MRFVLMYSNAYKYDTLEKTVIYICTYRTSLIEYIILEIDQIVQSIMEHNSKTENIHYGIIVVG